MLAGPRQANSRGQDRWGTWDGVAVLAKFVLVPNPMPDPQSAKVAGGCMLGWPGMGAWVGCVIMVRYAWAWCEMVAGGTWLGMVWWQLWTRGQCGVCMALTKSALSPGRRLAGLEWASPQENSRAWCTASRLSSKSLWVLIQMS